MSEFGKLSKEDWIKVGKGALVAGVGAAIIYVVDWTGTVDFGSYTVLASAISAVLVNVVRKFFTTTSTVSSKK
jgi:hypothetical protein